MLLTFALLGIDPLKRGENKTKKMGDPLLLKQALAVQCIFISTFLRGGTPLCPSPELNYNQVLLNEPNNYESVLQLCLFI